jgi:cation transport ATPase
MTQTYQITGMTCNGCRSKVQDLLSRAEGVKHAEVDLAKGEAEIEMEGGIKEELILAALNDYPKYGIRRVGVGPGRVMEDAALAGVGQDPEQAKSWIATYKPILLIFLYITVISLIAGTATATGTGTGTAGGGFSLMTAMRIFMAGFFLTFSFFKMLDIPAFAESYAMYDIVAKRFEVWGYLYVFIEALLGVSYALNFQPFFTTVVTVVVMTVSLTGVLNSVLAKRKIKCACLGAVFNLPMSSVTIIEDGLMISMGVAMIFVGKML